jgi:catechol 2,3-dioxygenase-like lactoylglutathione lyase family enzyme
MYRIDALDHVALIVQDLERSVAWYRSTLGMELRQEYQDTTGYGNPVVVGSGSARLALFPAGPELPVRRFPGHIAMRVSGAEFEEAQAHLRRLGIAFERVNYRTCAAVYFDDPDGHRLELCTYEIQR